MNRKPPPRAPRRGGTWAEYEAQKAKLAALGLSPREYERGVRKLAAKFGL